MDSEDLMSWLLLNPEVDFDNLTTALSGVVAESVAHSITTPGIPSGSVPVQPPLIPLVSQPVEYFKSFGPNTSSENLAILDDSLKRTYSNYSLHGYHSGNNLNGLLDANSHGSKSNDNLSQITSFNNPTMPQYRGFPSSSTSAIYGYGYASSITQSVSNNNLSTTSVGASRKVVSKPTSAKKRPRESVEDLEARVKELKAENADLHAHLLNVTQRTTEVQKQRVSMERLMAQKLTDVERGGEIDQAELAQIVKQYTDIYADYGRCRQREVSF